MVETREIRTEEPRAVARGELEPETAPAPRSIELERILVVAIAAASAVGAGLVHARPSGAGVSDFLLTTAFAVLVVAAASRAQPWALTVASGTAAVATSGAWTVVACLALAVCVIDSMVDLPARPVVGAAIGAAVVQVLLRLPSDRFALNLVLSVVAIGCLVVSGRQIAQPALRSRKARRVAILVGAAAVMAIVFLLFGALHSRHNVQVGIDRAEEGLKAARAGQSEEAARLLDEASQAFRSAHNDLGSWWTKPSLLLPGVGQQARALDLLSEAGSDLTRAASVAAHDADVQTLRVRDGRLDLGRVRAMAQPLAAVTDALDRADRFGERAKTPWLVAPIAQQLDEFNEAVDNATEDAATASEAVAVLPDILGGAGRREYFVVFATPAETRDLGGFMGAYGILTANDGKLSLTTTGRVRDLNKAGKGRQLTIPGALPDRFLRMKPESFWQNVTATSDFPTVAEAVRQMWPQTGDGQLDGVMYLDPETLAALMKLTGPVRLEGYDTPLTAETAPAFLLRDQYVLFPTDQRHDFLVDAAKTVFRKLTTGTLRPPKKIADTLAPVVNERRLMLHSFHPEEQALFERLDVDGALPPVDGDFLSVRASNRGQSKIDAFMHRTITDEVTVDPGRNVVHAKVTVSIRNDAPATGLPSQVIGNRLRPQGTNSTTVSVYSPLDLADVTIGGTPIGRGVSAEYGRRVYYALVDVPAGGEVAVVFELEGTMDVADGYRLELVPQPLVNPDNVQVQVHGAPGWSASADGTFSAVLRESARVTASFSGE
jgi:hypothetical protein